MVNSVVLAHLVEEHGNIKSDQPPGARRKHMDNKDAKIDAD